MLVLCLDTSTADVAAAVVLLHAGTVRQLSAQSVRDARGAGEHLMVQALAAAAAAGCALGELGALAVGLGPGPYTGLRVGVVTAAVLGRSLGIPAHGACSLDLWARPGAVVVTDARRREVYWGAYDDRGTRVAGPSVDRPADLAARLAGEFTGRPVTGPGTALYPELLGTDAVADPGRVIDVGRLAGLVAGELGTGQPPSPLVPLYLRRPDATEPVRAAVRA